MLFPGWLRKKQPAAPVPPPPPPKTREQLVAEKLRITDAGLANFKSGPARHNTIIIRDKDGKESPHPGQVTYCNNQLRIGITNTEIMLWCDVCEDILCRQKKVTPLKEPEVGNSGFPQMSDNDFLKILKIKPEQL